MLVRLEPKEYIEKANPSPPDWGRPARVFIMQLEHGIITSETSSVIRKANCGVLLAFRKTQEGRPDPGRNDRATVVQIFLLRCTPLPPFTWAA